MSHRKSCCQKPKSKSHSKSHCHSHCKSHGECCKTKNPYDIPQNKSICDGFDYSRRYPYDGSKAKYAYKFNLCDKCNE